MVLFHFDLLRWSLRTAFVSSGHGSAAYVRLTKFISPLPLVGHHPTQLARSAHQCDRVNELRKTNYCFACLVCACFHGQGLCCSLCLGVLWLLWGVCRLSACSVKGEKSCPAPSALAMAAWLCLAWSDVWWVAGRDFKERFEVLGWKLQAERLPLSLNT